MRKQYFLLILACFSINMWAADWDGILVPAEALPGMKWELDTLTSDDFNYSAPADTKSDTFFTKWKEGYHNAWTGPVPGFWEDDHTSVSDGKLRLRTSQVEGETVTYVYNEVSHTQDKTYLGCVTNKRRVKYPVYVETYVKIMNSVLASDVWMLSPDDTQEIDICEAYGSDRWTNAYFSPQRLHLSHHVFIRSPFRDWQPSDAGSFYTDGSTVWRDDYHRLGVYWKDPWNLEYYVDGQLVRTRSGKDEIDPLFYTNSTNPGDVNNDTRTGLSKEMDIIINCEDQTWRAQQGLTPTKAELANTENNTFKVDWIRVYIQVEGDEPVTEVNVVQETMTIGLTQKRHLDATIAPENATVKDVEWISRNEAVATVDQNGWVTGVTEGSVYIVATSHNGVDYSDVADSCLLTVQTDIVPVPVESITLSDTVARYSTNQVFTLTATVLPIDADDQSVTWSSSKETYATVDQNGVVSCQTVGGLTTITATAVGGLLDSCNLEVYEPAITWIDSAGIKAKVYTAGDSIEVSCTFDAKTGTVDSEGIKFWLRGIQSVNNFISFVDYTVFDVSAAGQTAGTASVKIPTDGIVPSDDLEDEQFYFLWISFNANSQDVPGLFPIIIEAVPATGITVTPLSDTILVDATVQLTATVLPANSSQKVSWSSSNTSIATVDSATGLVTGVSEGIATITVKSVDGDFEATSSITVEEIENSIDDISNTFEVFVYPVPAQDVIRLRGNLEAINQIGIYDLLGSEVYNSELTRTTIDVSQLKNGIYMLELIGLEYRQIKRIVINR